MSDEKDRRCGTCRSAFFHLTPTGKINKKVCGRCLFGVEWPKVPYFLVGRLPHGSWNGRFWSEGIWQDTKANCECWEPKA